ncbi:hypothetical protein PFICI_02587 [Pestalotiopsis fici W106-1]|uniref:Rhodopsin domain-containing protein n=1 Tax=Pestalotiopsis fici (strain W106-1 / CGMCC3.15140) TaxID=1229662 RepID=W3XGJ8_PESFW|nr:uncharacterized protein PFICI_02587 [Pestalotiopsis fici W106-1]ETS84562.1 hypothetical protein PFICI_02587 [Pestalotiopsis fici W106-1]
MRFPPPEVIASWPKPNYKDPENRGPALLIVELVALPLAIICVALRLYVRIHLIKRSGWDDWLMVAAVFFCCGVTVSVILATQLYGWNIHVWDLTFREMIQGRKVSIAGQTIFVFASGLAKLSILTSYLRIAVPGSWFRRLTWATIGIVAAAIPAFLLLLWLQCIPAASYWNLFSVERDCIPEAPPLMGQTIVTVITDFIVYILPMPTLWALKLPLFQRIGLMTVFGFGCVVVVAGCMRSYWIYHVEVQTYDVTWEGFYLWIWAAVEVNLGVICGCAPVLKPLLFGVAQGKGSQYASNAENTSFGFSKLSKISKAKMGMTSTRRDDDNNGYITLESLEAGKGDFDSSVSVSRPPKAAVPGIVVSDESHWATKGGYKDSF